MSTPRRPARVPRASRRRLLPAAAAALLCALCLFVAPPPTRAQTSTGSPNVVVSQFYSRGGETGAAHPNDFIELFNRGSNTVDLSQYTLQVTSVEGNVTSTIRVSFVSLGGGVPLRPGEYRTVTFMPLPPGPIPLPSALGPVGKIAIIKSREAIPQVDCPLGLAPDIEDYVGYGAATCFEGTGPAPTPTLALATYRNNNGCGDTDNNGADFTLAAAPSPRDSSTGGTPRAPCPLPPGTSTFRFTTSFIVTSENVPSVQVTVTRTGGDNSAPATVDYATTDGTATERKDYTTAAGTLRFAAGETSKSFDILINNDVFPNEGGGSEFFDLALSNPTGMTALADPSAMRITINDDDTTTVTANPIDDPTFFVRTHYADFLNRVPDQAGLDFWVGNITSCGADLQCREARRVNVSAAFFFAIEFQETGYYAYRLYKASFRNSPDNGPRPRGFPTYREFIRDTTDTSRDIIVGVGNWEEQLSINKQALADAFVTRAEFLARFPTTLTPAQYVDALNLNANNPLSQTERDALVNGLTAGTETRATALRRVADDADFRQAELNRAFVLMQYFGYLRRSPNAAPDTNFDGYDFWLSKLDQFDGNFVEAEMVRAFIESIEYRQRFGQ
ncbi:MAG TPA: Calx-beta domain-containing protein [Pyrinomonadaceae bacterium]